MTNAMRTLKKRRKENRTDYKARFNLLKSAAPRIVIRRSNKYFMLQAVETHEAQDKIITGVTSKDLIESGWNEKLGGSLKSVSAGYLTGLLMAKELGNKGKYILDIGMTRHLNGSRTYAVAKGLIEGGLDINVGEAAFPDDKRINGEHLKPEVKSMINKIKEKLK